MFCKMGGLRRPQPGRRPSSASRTWRGGSAANFGGVRRTKKIWAFGHLRGRPRFDLCASEGATGASIRDSENSKYCSSGDLPYRGEPDVVMRLEFANSQRGSGGDATKPSISNFRFRQCLDHLELKPAETPKKRRAESNATVHIQ